MQHGTTCYVVRQTLVNMVLRLMLNLSFDPQQQNEMVKHGILPRLVDFLRVQLHTGIALRLLYQFSREDHCKSLLSYTDVLPTVMGFVFAQPENDRDTGEVLHVNHELVALLVNLVANIRSAELICSKGWLEYMITRGLRAADTLLMKAVRNISQHDATKKHFKVCVLPLEVARIEEKGNRDCSDELMLYAAAVHRKACCLCEDDQDRRHVGGNAGHPRQFVQSGISIRPYLAAA